MLRNKFIIFACMLMAGFNANARSASNDQNATVQATGWNSGGNANNVNLAANEFILGGCTSAEWNSDCSGSENDEGAIIVQMAHKINDNGAYFCPTRVQIANYNFNKKIWVNFYGLASATDCKWICKSGYTGDNCQTVVSGYDAAKKNFDFMSLHSPNYHFFNFLTANALPVFDIQQHVTASSDKNASVTVLAILKYMNHGVVVGRLKVNGLRDTAGFGTKSWVSGVEYPTEKFMLCDAGYQPNSARTDCEVMPTPEPPKTMCNGWTEAEYTANAANLYYVKRGNCWQYRCSGENRAFTSETNRACTDCGTGVRGGATPDTGVCRVCNVGQYFNEKNGNCVEATGLSKTDLQYGRGKSKSANTGDECWTKTTPKDYKECVLGKTSSQNVLLGNSVGFTASVKTDNTSVAIKNSVSFDDMSGATAAPIR